MTWTPRYKAGKLCIIADDDEEFAVRAIYKRIAEITEYIGTITTPKEGIERVSMKIDSKIHSLFGTLCLIVRSGPATDDSWFSQYKAECARDDELNAELDKAKHDPT